MKKIITIALVLALCLALFAGCAGNQGSAEKMKVGFIFLHDENSTYDLNFLNAAKQACDKMGVEAILKTNIPEGQECYEAAADLVDQGCSLVFADSFGHEDFLIQAAKEFKDVQFCHATGTKAHTENLPNFHNALPRIVRREAGRWLCQDLPAAR